MNVESMMHHSKGKKQPNPLEALMQLRTVKEFIGSDIKKWDMVNPNNGNTILHYNVRCNSWHSDLIPFFCEQINVNTLNNAGKVPLMLLIEQSPCYIATEDEQAIENLKEKFLYLLEAGALLTGRSVMDNSGKTPIERLNGLIKIGKNYHAVIALHALMLKELLKTGQQDLLVTISKAAL